MMGLVKENTAKYLHNLGIGKEFLEKYHKTPTLKEKKKKEEDNDK